MNLKEFADKLGSDLKAEFPTAFVQAIASGSICDSATVKFSFEPREKWGNGIWHNAKGMFQLFISERGRQRETGVGPYQMEVSISDRFPKKLVGKTGSLEQIHTHIMRFVKSPELAQLAASFSQPTDMAESLLAEAGPPRLPNGAFNVPMVDQSIRSEYEAGKLSLEDAAREFHKHGWTNFIDLEYTKRKLGLGETINKEFLQKFLTTEAAKLGFKFELGDTSHDRFHVNIKPVAVKARTIVSQLGASLNKHTPNFRFNTREGEVFLIIWKDKIGIESVKLPKHGKASVTPDSLVESLLENSDGATSKYDELVALADEAGSQVLDDITFTIAGLLNGGLEKFAESGKYYRHASDAAVMLRLSSRLYDQSGPIGEFHKRLHTALKAVDEYKEALASRDREEINEVREETFLPAANDLEDWLYKNENLEALSAALIELFHKKAGH